MSSSDAEEALCQIRDQVARLQHRYATPERLKALLDQTVGFDRALWQAAVEQGQPAIAVPEHAGGMGMGWPGLAALMEEVGKAVVSLPLIATPVVAEALLASDDEAPAARYLAPLVSGELIACVAFAEPGQTSPLQRPELACSGDTLNGSKAAAAFAAVADLALVHADADGASQLMLVPLDQPGVTRRTQPGLDNARAHAALQFRDAKAYPLLRGDAAIGKIMARVALATAFEQIGGASACLACARGYALERKAFGQPIGRFQAIKHKLVDMYWRIEIARGCALDALDALEGGNPLWPALAAAARLAAIEAYDFAARENIQTHGAMGVTWEAMPHHYYRRARCLALELGSTQAWREYLLAEAGFDAAAA
ncbi:acyl-CoA dehydrogenase family protein [Fulvimonas soli]|uniref:Alkylation response protein AidB-like acyl-CoA dehydrogenase n=1 Tax=Fulvimonas soli TaxID=155197 RepID=A0A316IE44_9GAMM|nr:acyl-CoA dehydrogenase family protein [Fulvimonas soli]PWK91907.1 hypothetical protein C7456_10326 [Fulvimonas soli]TNY26034.1 hypothetical protein BV497_10795 [Fulvimonas soli]